MIHKVIVKMFKRLVWAFRCNELLEPLSMQNLQTASAVAPKSV